MGNITENTFSFFYYRKCKNVQEGELAIGPGASISYHNQWWIPHNEQGAFEVLGSYGQTLYIDPKQIW